MIKQFYIIIFILLILSSCNDTITDMLQENHKTYLRINNNSGYNVNVYIDVPPLFNIAEENKWLIENNSFSQRELQSTTKEENGTTLYFEYLIPIGKKLIPYFSNNVDFIKLIRIEEGKVNTINIPPLINLLSDFLFSDTIFLLINNLSEDIIWLQNGAVTLFPENSIIRDIKPGEDAVFIIDGNIDKLDNFSIGNTARFVFPTTSLYKGYVYEFNYLYESFPQKIIPEILWRVKTNSTNILEAKLTWLNENAINNSEYSISICKDEYIYPQILSFYDNNITITVRSLGQPNIINLLSNGSLFTINSGVILILENVILRGKEKNNNSLICINNGGKLIMNNGSVIADNGVYSNNINNDMGGGGIFIRNGTFIMNGGNIKNNFAGSWGGGVYLHEGVFTMNAGEIYNNITGKASRESPYQINFYGGGGVYILDGTFNMKGGEIFNNSTPKENNVNSFGGGVLMKNGMLFMSSGVIYGSTSALGNTSSFGNSLYFIQNSTAQSGTYNNDTFNLSGNFESNVNVTIRVVNGNVQTY